MKRYKMDCGCSFVIDESLPAIHGHPALIYNPNDISFECKKTWDLISSGMTKGVFQLESPLGRQWAKRLGPRNIEHLAALGALLRPGCLKAKDEDGVNMTERYCRRKNGEEESVSAVPQVSDILEPTYNVMCYQEQMMAIAAKVAGFNLVEVDTLRKAAGKKDVELMAKVGKMFVEGAEKTKIITKEQAEYLFDIIKKSGRYLFNKSHSVAYGIIGYQTAHLKAHFPVQFFTSYLYHAKEKQDPLKEIRELVNDARAFGFTVQPPSFEELRPGFGIDDAGVIIRFGLADVKGIGHAVINKMRQNIERVEADCKKHRTTWTWFEFLLYFSAYSNAGVVRRMIQVGAFQNFKLDRKKMLAEFEVWNELTDREQEAVANLSQPLYKMVAVKVHDPEKGRKVSKRDENGEVVYNIALDSKGDKIRLDDPRPVDNLTDAISAILERPGIISKGRREKVESLLKTLLNPPTSTKDSSAWIAKVEEESLGIPISCSRSEDSTESRANTTCQEYREGKGKNGKQMILAVDVQDFREIPIQNGSNRGKKMAYVTVSDHTGALEDVTFFSEAWATYGNIVSPGNTIEITGRRDRNRDSLIVDEARQL